MRLRFSQVSLTMACFMILSFGGMAGLSSDGANAATKAPITIAYICDCTGPGGPEDIGVMGAFRARIDQQNAMGGVDGHKISTLILDDQTSPTQDSTAVQDAVSHKVIGIVADTALFFSGAKYAQEAGIPVTGSFQDGPEWGEQPYTNMFASDNGSVDPKYPVNNGIGKFLVSKGGNVVATYGYGISPSSSRSAIGAVQSVIHAGGKEGEPRYLGTFWKQRTSRQRPWPPSQKDVNSHLRRHGRQLQLCPGHRHEAGRGQAQSRRFPDRLRAVGHHVARLDRPTRRLFRLGLSSLPAAQCWDRSHARQRSRITTASRSHNSLRSSNM